MSEVKKTNLVQLHFACIIACLAFAQVSRAQVPTATQPSTDTLSSDWQFGFELFQMLFRQRGLEPEHDLRHFLSRNPENCVLVLTGRMGKMSYSFQNDLRRFIDNGGALLIATDRGNYLSQLCSIQQGPIKVKSSDAYLGYEDCPLITMIDEEHRITLGVNKIVANRCGWLSRFSIRHGEWTTLARLPGTLEPLIAALESNRPYHGKLLVAADHSLFINGMLWHGDNAMLAVNVSNWLCEGTRKHVLFLSDGLPLIAQNLDNLPPPPTPDTNLPENIPDLPPKSLLTFANSFLTGLEDANVLNDMAAGQPRNISDRTYHRALLLFAVGVIGLITLCLLMKNGPRITVPNSRKSSPLMAQRIDDLKNSTDLRPLTQELAQEFMISLTGSTNQEDWIMNQQQVQLQSSVRKQKLIRADLQRIGQIANEIEKFSITTWDFDQLAKKITRLQLLNQQGQLQLVRHEI